MTRLIPENRRWGRWVPPVPIESVRPVASFAVLRLASAVVAIAALAVFDVPHRVRLIVLVAAAGVPFSLIVLRLARRAPALALHPAVAAADLAILAAAEAIAPSSYAAVRFLALFLIAAHAHFQGEQRGVALAAVAVAVLVPVAVLVDTPVAGGVLAFYETLFAASALAGGLFMGRLRTAESTGRLRARETSRRVIAAESQVRRRLAEALHDGPVQELVSLDLVLDAAHRALERGERGRADELVREARDMAQRNVGALREEIVGLGPYAIDEMTVDTAVEQCAPVWSRRYGLRVELDLDRIELSNEACGALFGVVQEAVANAGRHAGARVVTVSLHRTRDGAVELVVRDDGHGFDPDDPPFAADDPGHIGLVTMRERTEVAGGALNIESGPRGTAVIARVPVAATQDSPAPS